MSMGCFSSRTECAPAWGQAEATATAIYTAAYNQSPLALEMYTFLQTMDTYKKTLTNGTTLILTTKSDLFKFLKSANPQK